MGREGEGGRDGENGGRENGGGREGGSTFVQPKWADGTESLQMTAAFRPDSGKIVWIQGNRTHRSTTYM